MDSACMLYLATNSSSMHNVHLSQSLGTYGNMGATISTIAKRVFSTWEHTQTDLPWEPCWRRAGSFSLEDQRDL